MTGAWKGPTSLSPVTGHWSLNLAGHWDRVTPISALLWPLSHLFRAVTSLRRAVYRAGLATAHRVPVPVIVVGNLTVGGTGKTPVVLWLAGLLRAQGHCPGIVSRGYGGTQPAPREVTPDSDPHECGDEPVLLARRSDCAVWTGARRAAAARALLAAQPACNVLISDDGLQHYGLARDFEVCVVDGSRLLGNGWLLPAGPLREPATRLASVDAIVINDGDRETGGPLAGLADPARVPQFQMTLEGRELYNLLNRGHRIDAGSLRGRRVHAIAGIGNPARFFRHLQGLGLDFVAHPFPDHHHFRPSDILYPDADAIVMTEKDAVKCQAFAGDTHWVLPVEAVIDARLGELVLGRLESYGRGRPHR